MFEQLYRQGKAIRERFIRKPNPGLIQIDSVPPTPYLLERRQVTSKERTHFFHEETKKPLEVEIVQGAIQTAIEMQKGNQPPSFEELCKILEIDKARVTMDSAGRQPINEKTELRSDGGETTSTFQADETHIASSHMVTTVNEQGVDIDYVTLRYSNPKIILIGGEPTFCFGDHSVSVHSTRAGANEVYSDFELRVGVGSNQYCLLVVTNNFQTEGGVVIESMPQVQRYAI